MSELKPTREEIKTRIAELVHDAMVWAAKQGGEPQRWQNGNSIAEALARTTAAAAMDACDTRRTLKTDEETVEALRDAREALALGAALPAPDPRHREEVVSVGTRIGFGALMSIASLEWRNRLGSLAGSEFCSGPCRSTAEAAIQRINAALSSIEEQRG